PLGSELEKLSGALADSLPPVDLERQARAIELVREAVRTGLVGSAHDVSEGGLAVALAECCIAGGLGATVELPSEEMLFGEGPGGVIVSGPVASIDKLAEMAAESGFLRLGEVRGDRLVIAGFAATLSVPVVDLATAFETGIPAKFS
ncbi:MAG TPA: AIR synthase-related protein, partial [Thermoleophilaceae bacterium]